LTGRSRKGPSIQEKIPEEGGELGVGKKRNITLVASGERKGSLGDLKKQVSFG